MRFPSILFPFSSTLVILFYFFFFNGDCQIGQLSGISEEKKESEEEEKFTFFLSSFPLPETLTEAR